MAKTFYYSDSRLYTASIADGTISGTNFTPSSVVTNENAINDENISLSVGTMEIDQSLRINLGSVLNPDFAAYYFKSTETADLSSSIAMLTPSGRPLTQQVVEELAGRRHLILLCGRYEGFDQRICDTLKPDAISVGNYVLSGGEVAAMVIIDAVARLIPGVLGDSRSAVDDSFSGTERLIEGPQYTRPREYRGLRVPDVLLNGDHQRIADWRKAQATQATHRHTTKHTEK